uniref:Uncharacterized protein n=1 Tax=Solanum lycopersicum TaxID=4081 RepID=A0A3Q7FUM4_SOLLC
MFLHRPRLFSLDLILYSCCRNTHSIKTKWPEVLITTVMQFKMTRLLIAGSVLCRKIHNNSKFHPNRKKNGRI